MKKIFIILAAVFLFCFSLLAQDFGKMMQDDAGSLWGLTPDKFKTAFGAPEIYKWKNALKTELIYDFAPQKTKLYFLGQQISNASFSFFDRHLQGMLLTLATPEGQIDEKTYLERVNNLQKQITALGKIKRPQVVKRVSSSRCRCNCLWKSSDYYISLKWDYSTEPGHFKAGQIAVSIFYRGTFTPAAAATERPERPENTGKGKSNSNLKTDDKGGRYLEVPMLTQKSTEDCITACIKRILAYNKIIIKRKSWKRIEENLEFRTKSAKAMKGISGAIAQALHCRVRKLVNVTIFDDFDTMTSFVRTYNAQAVKAKKNRLDSFKENTFNGLIKAIDEDVLLNTRNDAGQIADFKSRVCSEIDAGRPVLWIVFLGVVKESPDPLVSSGGHARLIVGYNPGSDELIYSDCWGEGHELKKMSWNKAWAITLTALSIAPPTKPEYL